MYSNDPNFHPLCAFCKSVDESIDHHFGHCPFAINVWKHFFSDQSALSFSNGFITWLDNLISCYVKDSFSLLVALIFSYNIWYARNILIFQGKVSYPTQVSHMSQTIASGYWKANNGFSSK